jgi:hypothetical protein
MQSSIRTTSQSSRYDPDCTQPDVSFQCVRARVLRRVEWSWQECERIRALLIAVWYPGWTSSPLWIYVLLLVGQSVILTYGANLARFGIVTPIAMHATLNTVSRFLGGLFVETQPSAHVPFELVMALCGFATAVTLILATRGRLAYRDNAAPGNLTCLASLGR